MRRNNIFLSIILLLFIISAVIVFPLTTSSDTISGITLTSGGSGYATVPTVTFSGGGGSGATATATTANGTITGITITDPGVNYSSVPSVIIGDGVTQATANSTLSPTNLASISLTVGGSGYTSAPTVTITGGGGSGATATATIAGGAVTAIKVTNSGAGYTSTPNVAFDGGGGSGATAIAVLTATGVGGFTVTDGGSGYSSAPSVTLNGNGTGATATATVSGGKVTDIKITNPGTGYTAAPVVSLTGGGGSGAIASALITKGGILGNKPIKLGVDLKGGAEIVYQADMSNVPVNQQATVLAADAAAIRSRVDALGVAEPTIDILSGNRIRVVLAGVTNIDQAKQAIGSTALLEFGVLASDPNDPAIKWRDDLGNWKPAVGTVNGQQVALTSAFFDQNTSVNVDNSGQIVLEFQWDAEGSQLSNQITSILVTTQAPLGIFSGTQPLRGADGHPIAPSVIGVISDRGQITGLTQVDASQLSKLLNAGRLSVPLTVTTENTVATSLGDQFVGWAFKAALIALGLVMVFMIVYYRLPGVLASLALIFYALINLAIYKMVPVTLSLAGIGGFIASMGMAVDANVLIFERMKEELRAGRTVGAAIEAGFNRAWSAIWDSNVTTFIAAIIMYILGSTTVVNNSLVTGFALTLFIGVAVSMFTAIVVTRSLLRLFIGSSIAQKLSLFQTIGGK